MQHAVEAVARLRNAHDHAAALAQVAQIPGHVERRRHALREVTLELCDGRHTLAVVVEHRSHEGRTEYRRRVLRLGDERVVSREETRDAATTPVVSGHQVIRMYEGSPAQSAASDRFSRMCSSISPEVLLRPHHLLIGLLSLDIGVTGSFLRQGGHGGAGRRDPRADEAAWNENVQRQKDYEVHEQTRSIVLLFAERRGLARDRRQQAARLGPPCRGRRCRSCTRSSATGTRPAARSSARWRRSCSRAGASCRTAIRIRRSASATASTCRSSPTRACAS